MKKSRRCACAKNQEVECDENVKTLRVCSKIRGEVKLTKSQDAASVLQNVTKCYKMLQNNQRVTML